MKTRQKEKVKKKKNGGILNSLKNKSWNFVQILLEQMLFQCLAVYLASLLVNRSCKQVSGNTTLVYTGLDFYCKFLL